MIKITAIITKPLQDETETEESFLKVLFDYNCIRFRVNNPPGIYRSFKVKKDDIDRFYLEISGLVMRDLAKWNYSEAYKRENFENKTELEIAQYLIETGPRAQRSLKKLEELGYKRKVKYFEVPPEFEKIYKESITGDVFVNCPYFLNGCDCNVCKWVRSLEIPNVHEHDGPPTKLEQIGKTGYESEKR